MPLPPADKPSDSPADARPVVMLRSPRDAAAQAIVYRRRRAERPRDRGLRIAGLAGTLLVHLLVLFGAILGPAYDLPEPPRDTAPLQVRLIDKPEPPPPPPVRGTPPRLVGPRHRGNTRAAVTRATQAPATPPTPAPSTPDTPVITVTAPKATIEIARAAAPPPPLTLPRPQPTPDLTPVPLAGTPPRINLDTPPTERPVPPKFQPEPVRKPQPEGNRPMPAPPSLAMPAVPAQAAPPVVAPSIALDQVAPPKASPPSTVDLVRPQPPAAPITPQVQAIPLPAQVAPTINLAPEVSAPAPLVPRERPRVQVPSIQLAEPQLSAVPLETTAAPAAPKPAAPTIDVSRATSPATSIVLARPQIAATPSTEPAPTQAAVPAAPTGEAAATASADAQAPENAPASAPEATPQGSDTGTPGAREAAPEAANANGAPAPQTGQGSGQGEGRQGKAQPGAAGGAEKGQVGSYIQLKPHGDTEIMDHRVPDIGYRPTRFEDDWAPEGESSIDTALRHAVEKTTIKHTFHLPRGVRLNCKVSPLFPIALLGCGGDPPAKAARDPELYERLNLAPVKSLDPTAAASAAKTASTNAPAAPIHLDNAAQCAAARVSGGPLPPGCPGDGRAPPQPIQAPAPATSSWVPPSDQFR
ncbi:hypothetical protein [Frateuria soli]|uniref:hypothetical protein n=1 Tax=Frateuria soli TaxID=1542730 RepID=UPI001E54BB23|nr:hypothetical protein [Frateuria soli]UGB37487.1 hypothetical protein LQ771_11695 [Frateuria soli]